MPPCNPLTRAKYQGEICLSIQRKGRHAIHLYIQSISISYLSFDQYISIFILIIYITDIKRISVGGRSPPQPTPSLFDTVQNPTVPSTLTHLTASQILKPGSERPIHVMILPHKPPLSPIPKLIKLVSPMTLIPEPTCGGGRIAGCGNEGVVHVFRRGVEDIVCVCAGGVG